MQLSAGCIPFQPSWVDLDRARNKREHFTFNEVSQCNHLKKKRGVGVRQPKEGKSNLKIPYLEQGENQFEYKSRVVINITYMT